MTGGAGSIRGGALCSAFFFSSRTASWRGGLVLAPRAEVAARGDEAADPGVRGEDRVAEPVHDLEPRQAEEQRHPGEPAAEQQQRRA